MGTTRNVGNKEEASLVMTVDANGIVRAGASASSTATLSNIASVTSSGTILAANSGRVGMSLYNDSSAQLNLKYGATASTTSFTVPIPAFTQWDMPTLYTGQIDGIWIAANGFARVTELT